MSRLTGLCWKPRGPLISGRHPGRSLLRRQEKLFVPMSRPSINASAVPIFCWAATLIPAPPDADTWTRIRPRSWLRRYSRKSASVQAQRGLPVWIWYRFQSSGDCFRLPAVLLIIQRNSRSIAVKASARYMAPVQCLGSCISRLAARPACSCLTVRALLWRSQFFCRGLHSGTVCIRISCVSVVCGGVNQSGFLVPIVRPRLHFTGLQNAPIALVLCAATSMRKELFICLPASTQSLSHIFADQHSTGFRY